MSSTSALLETRPETIQDRLRNLCTGTRQTHWLTRDLKLTPSSAPGRFFFTVVVKRLNCLRWIFLNIDLEDAKHDLIRIGWNQIDQRNFSDVELFRTAALAFSRFAPQHPIPEMKGYYLEQLTRGFARYAFTNLITHTPLPRNRIKSLSTNPSIGLSYQVIFKLVKDFEKKGGHVHCMEPMENRELDEGFALRKTDDIAPICHAGLVRSKIIKEVIEQKLGIKTRNTHGVLNGYTGADHFAPEDHLEGYFEEAFLKKRSNRFGHNIPLPRLERYFLDRYWSRINPNGRVIFVTFSNTFALAIHYLQNYHPNLSQVHVIIIPDPDWISHYKGSKASKECFHDLVKTNERVAQALHSNESIFLNNPTFEKDDYFVNAIGAARYSPDPEAFYEFLQPYVYRHAFHVYAQYFNLEA